MTIETLPPPRFNTGGRVRLGFAAAAIPAVIGAAGSIGGGLIGASSAAKAAKKAANIAASQAWSDVQMEERAYEDTQPWRNVGSSAVNRLSMLMGLGRLPAVNRRYVPQNYNDPFFNETPAPWLGFGGGYGSTAGAGGSDGGSGSGGTDTMNGAYVGGSLVKPGAGSGGISATTGAQSQSATSGGGELTPEQIRADQMAAFDLFTTDPGYEFRLGEGEKARERSAAARGGALSGATMKALDRYAQGEASNEYGNYMNRLLSLAGFGPVGTQQSQSAALGFGGLAQQARLAEGNARGSGYANQGAAWMNGLNGLGQSLGSINWGSLGGGGGGGMSLGGGEWLGFQPI